MCPLGSAENHSMGEYEVSSIFEKIYLNFRLVSQGNCLLKNFLFTNNAERYCFTSIHDYTIHTITKAISKIQSKDHSNSLARRLEVWKNGDIELLLKEAKYIKKKLTSSRKARSVEGGRHIHNFCETGYAR